MTPTEFLAKYPEFRNGGTLVTAYLADATLQVDPEVFGAKAEMAIGLLAAHLLAESPFAKTLQLVGEDGKTPYLKQFELLRRQVVTRILVT